MLACDTTFEHWNAQLAQFLPISNSCQLYLCNQEIYSFVLHFFNVVGILLAHLLAFPPYLWHLHAVPLCMLTVAATAVIVIISIVIIVICRSPAKQLNYSPQK